MSLEERLAAPEHDVEAGVAEGSAARLRLEGVPEGAEVRWMSAAGAGSLLELDPVTADVLAEDLVFDDGLLEERTPTGPGLYHQLVLVLDGEGGNRWTWVDAAIGVDVPLVRHEGRLLALAPGDDPTPGPDGLLAVTLRADDSLAGVSLEDPAPAEDLSGGEVTCGLPDVAFRLAWLAEGRCTRSEVDGRRVVLALW